ncbi:MAG: oxidoreductase domain protein [Bryobacterales bacterium]|nr:oxidoreductase domain protein [Bryobacterales bacterium]
MLNKRLGEIETAGKKRPAGYSDLRKLLEDKSIDAISIATPNHSHTLQTIWGCQAGEDVYVEKPCSHNMFEARQIVAAARKYNRIVQQGSQSRSAAALQDGVQKMRNGFLGDVYMARGLCYKWRDTIGRTSASPVPEGVDYDLWLGPAPKHEFTKNRFHYN